MPQARAALTRKSCSRPLEHILAGTLGPSPHYHTPSGRALRDTGHTVTPQDPLQRRRKSSCQRSRNSGVTGPSQKIDCPERTSRHQHAPPSPSLSDPTYPPFPRLVQTRGCNRPRWATAHLLCFRRLRVKTVRCHHGPDPWLPLQCPLSPRLE